VVENVLIFFAIFNASGAPLSWVANHRHHHAKADTAEDISSPPLRWFLVGAHQMDLSVVGLRGSPLVS
jgi:fatty-acid desaturase